MKATTCALLLAMVASTAAAPHNQTKRAGPGKRGLVWTFYNGGLDPGRLNDGKGSVNLIYDYETSAPLSTNGNGGLNFIGMQRCKDCDSSPIALLAQRQKQLGFSTLFTLNEPDKNGISPADAADWYKQHINPFTIHKALPAISSSANAGEGVDWLQQMISACAGQCFFDYINLHHYGPDFNTFKNYINSVHARFPNTKLVVTEFALQNPPGGQAAQIAFFKQAFAFLDASPFVEMYFPFLASTPALFAANDAKGAQFVGTGSALYNNDGTINDVGRLMFQAF